MAKKQHYVMKVLGLIILASILQTYVCSTLCSITLSDCEGELNPIHDCCDSAVPLESDNNNGKTDCQDEHFVFMQTLGQFHAFSDVTLNPINWVFDNAIPNTEIAFSHLPQNTIAVYTGFVPPPPKDGISVFIQSFLI